ncbi:AVAST type 2 anti-phage system protein Avs2, partial [Legionella sp.]|uniref:AVAST type 2 anti-phage system protein Avs2 n=1 Tax=Legionella sp. TaxID=459 RepID=UPI00322058E1
MSQNVFWNEIWANNQLEKIKLRAGNRYTPELNIELPIAEIFDGISRTENFYISIRKHYGVLKREFDHVSSKYNCEETQSKYRDLQRTINSLSILLEKLKKYDTNKIPWPNIKTHARKANEASRALSAMFRKEIDRIKKEKIDNKGPWSTSEKLESDLRHTYQVLKELIYFEELSTSTKARLSSSPFLLLTGVAGTGKTHLLCDIVEGRIRNNKLLPAVLVFGEFFATIKDPFSQIIKQLDLNFNKTQFLRSLNNAGKQTGCRALLIVDALNETRQQNYWKKNLGKVVNEVRKYPNVALIISVRSGFEGEVLSKKQNKVFSLEEHQGFQFREWEAVSKFFNEFKLPLPEIPLLTPEFQNPLFLLLFCKAFQHRTRRNKGKIQKQIFRGHEGATYIFETFVDSVSKRLLKQFNLDKNAANNIWDSIIENIAAEMVNCNNDRVPENRVSEIVINAYPSIDHVLFMKELERNMLLVKVPAYSTEKSAYDGFEYRFPFQKFSDHLIGRYLFKKYEKEFGKSNKNLQTAKKFFSKRRKLGKSLSTIWYRGIIEALSIQCPEHLKGCEFVEVAPYLKSSHEVKEAFIESLVWRKPEAFSADLRSIKEYINKEIIRTEWGFNSFLNALLSIAPIPNHPFNAVFLHNHLSRFSMAKRDSWWSTFLHYQYDQRGAVDRLVDWGWSGHDKSHINDRAIHLCSIALLWFLTTSNRFLRDKSTKALVALLTDRLNIVLDLLKQFQDVNDPYISERLYAVAYGYAVRTQKDEAGLIAMSKWVYKNLFQGCNPPVNILLRDYARGIIEVALNRKLNLRISRKKIEPPFKSIWPKNVPSEKLLRNKYYPNKSVKEEGAQNRDYFDIWFSVMHDFGSIGDFGNYVLNSAVTHWSGRKLDGKDINRKQLFSNFKKGLTRKQEKLLEKATKPFLRGDLSKYSELIGKISSNIEVSTDEKESERRTNMRKREMEKSYIDFENSLSTRSKKSFKKEIKPFINNWGDINDPLEQFNTKLAQRWVFDRVVKLGWEPKLHGEFDQEINGIDRSEQKAERIGKKYQWIALHELLARISDNFEFRDEANSDKVGRYEGAWQLNIRDIDPSCLLKEFPESTPDTVPSFTTYKIQNCYSAWNKQISDPDWLKRKLDLPDPKHILEIPDTRRNNWLVLEGFVEWQDKTPPEYEKYNLPTRRLWYMIKGYLINREDKDKIIDWAKRQNFMERWMPEAHEFYRVYLGEYPWASAFLYHYVPYYNHDEWTNNTLEKKIPAKVLTLDDQYVSSGSHIDCSTSESISVKLPAKFIIDEMNLVQKFMDGRFFDTDGDLVAFDPNVFSEYMPRSVLIRKDKLRNFLQSRRYT